LSDRPASNPSVRLEDRFKIHFWRAVNRLFCRTYHHVDVRSPCRLPKAGPAIVVCNHTSGLDPMLLQSACMRIVVWMMAKEYYDLKSLRWFFTMIEAIPVNRDGRDSAATRAALRALHAGNVLGVFPEGRIEPDRNLLPFQTGVAMLAIRTGVPVYPAYIEGDMRGKEMLDAFKSPRRARLRFGPEVKIPRHDTSQETLAEATDAIRRAVESLKAMDE
jgi:1-acyl-sn-glycerol-3-phosphate acyltransferase